MRVRRIFVWPTPNAVVSLCVLSLNAISSCGSRSSLDELPPTALAAQQVTDTANATGRTGATTTVPTNQHPVTTPASTATTNFVSPEPPSAVTPNTGVVAPDPTVPPPTMPPPNVAPILTPPEHATCTDSDALRHSQLLLVAPAPSLQRIVIPRVCGDGRITLEESCDDANLNPGDGCSATCQTEPYYECPVPGESCVFTGSCGDGVVTGPEQCEYTGAPGCSDQCTLESGWVCPLGQPCLTVCGDGITAGLEGCDDGNNVADDGCSPSCRIEFDYCRTHGCNDGAIGICGNGLVDLGEACDDGGVSQSCSASCQWLPQCTSDSCASICGDGLVIDESCDDGNVVDGDGCDSTCNVDLGFQCAQVPVDFPSMDVPPPEFIEPTTSQCTALCGDAMVTAAEACDSGELNGIDGYCRVDCTLGPFCGDGVIDDGENCDDGRNVGHQGDPSSCPPGCVSTGFCGDGILQTEQGEACDSGRVYNNGAYNGCTSYCTLAAYCGDGKVQECGQEVCDVVGNSDTCVNCRYVTIR